MKPIDFADLETTIERTELASLGQLTAGIAHEIKNPLNFVNNFVWPSPSAAQTATLLNASYDPTRRFYAAFNKAFAAHWRAERGEAVRLYQSHGGSGAQARNAHATLDRLTTAPPIARR
jgi:ABC-type sulfate transport system substrate-binding protein